MPSITRTLVLALSASAAYASTVTTVLNDLATVDSDVKSIDSLVNQYPGSSPGSLLLTINNKITTLVNDINTTTNDVNAVSPSPPTTSDATRVYNYICVSPLINDATTLVNDTINKKSAFASQAATKTVHDDCVKVKTAIDSLSSALIAKITDSSLKSKASTCSTNYDTLLNKCINAFAT